MTALARFDQMTDIEEISARCGEILRARFRALNHDWSGGLKAEDLPPRQNHPLPRYNPIIPPEAPSRFSGGILAIGLLSAFVAIAAQNPLSHIRFDFFSVAAAEKDRPNPNIRRFAVRQMAPDCGLVPNMHMTCLETLMKARIR